MNHRHEETAMADEILFPWRINADPVKVPPGLVPARTTLTGAAVRLEPLDPVRHAAALYRAGHDSEAALQSWEYLPWGPFPSEEALRDQLRSFAAALDFVFYAVCDPVTGPSRLWGIMRL
jgi:RimJ/RimL family protein N-acetyltransferase